MRMTLGIALGVLGMIGASGSMAAVRAEAKTACPPEVSQAGAMVAKAQDVIKAAKQGGTEATRTPAGDPASGAGRTLQVENGAVAGRTPLLDQGTGTARGLATSSASEISPWAPRPGDKTLQARTTQARKLTAQARRLCRTGKVEDAKTKATEAINVLDPK